MSLQLITFTASLTLNSSEVKAEPFRVSSHLLSWHWSKNSTLCLGLHYCDVLFALDRWSVTDNITVPGNQSAPRLTLGRGRHRICKITSLFHELTTENAVLNIRMPRASIIHYAALPLNQLYWLNTVLTYLLWVNKISLTLKVWLSRSLSRSEDAELLNFFVITPAFLPGYTKLVENLHVFRQFSPDPAHNPKALCRHWYYSE